eukprot:CAMPEP_0194217010 /NCGR_PEP_ID=MMETSP0156-20130528/20144_1 /TAXON_ID=33649 /ORGANISM="Thalassionema nitzschioides, Strain L26-B" /LENGTH=944 /DNA_ID=CAMNT_0038945919 /DNA_START=131 /DNA_END=2965 /DNA_ORIENTATION=+
MRSAWQGEQLHSTDRQDHQTSLGQFIERSTSAPPGSTEMRLKSLDDERNDGRNVQQLLNSNNSNAGFFPSGMGRQSAALSSSTGVPASSVLGGLEETSGPSGASYPGSFLSDALLSSGLSKESLQHSTPAMVRSQSAAPNLLNRSSGIARVVPPPGLGNISNSNHQRDSDRDNYNIGSQQQRPASTGLIGENSDRSSSMLSSLGIDSFGTNAVGTVRPAPKTLMDLIQENTSPVSNHINNESFGGHGNFGTTRSQQTAAPAFAHEDISHERSRTASPPLRYDALSEHFNQRINIHGDSYQMQQQQQPDITEQYLPSDQINRLPQGVDRFQAGRQQYPASQQRPEPHRPHRAQYVKVPVSQVQRGQAQINNHQEIHHDSGRMHRVYQPATHAHTIPQQQQQQHQPSAHQYENSQQIYYTNDQQGGPIGVEASLPANQSTLTAATLANGQIVYLNTSPYGGYATIQYRGAPPPSQPQHTHIVHQTRQQIHGRDYVSVLPVQTGNTGQMAYWTGAESSTIGPTVIMNQQTPITMSRAGPNDTSPSRSHVKEAERGGNQKTNSKSRRPANTQAGNRRDEARCKHGVTSPLLEKFRITKNRDWTMLDIKGNVVEFCQDQNGSRFIQQRLEIGNASEQQVVMEEVLPAVRQLRNDVFGNYVVQKLLEFGSRQMKEELRDTLKGEMLQLSLQMYGCRVVQKALETLNEDDLPKLLIEFHHNVLSCIHDQNGNHVIQKCIEVMSNKAKQAYSVHDGERAKFFGEQIDFIINDVLENVTPLSCHPYGCRVLQRILEHCVEPKKVRALDEISKSHKVLLDDQYGNYVIQHVLQYGRHEDRESVMHIVIANGLLQLSKQKFASNVVEKLLKYGTPNQRNILVREMLQVVDDLNTGGSSVVLLMVRDAYANYVVQTTLDVVSEGDEKKLLLEELNAHSTQLRQYTFAKHIVTKLSS